MLDIFTTVFNTRGAKQMYDSFTNVARAQERVAAAESRLQAISAKGGASQAKIERRIAQLADAQRDLISAHLRGAVVATAALAIEGRAIDEMIDKYRDFGREVMNIRDLTGATGAEAAKAALMFRAAGLSDMQEIREVLKLNKAVFEKGGQTALARLGISASPDTPGLEMFNKVADALQTFPDGLRKSQIIEEIFGTRGAAALLPLLRLTKEQRQEVSELSDAFDTKGLAAIQRYDFATNMLGQTIEQRFTNPIAARMLPVMERIVEWITVIFNWWGKLDRLLGGVPSWILALLTLGTVLATIVTVVTKLGQAFGVAAELARTLAASEALAQFVAGDVTAFARLAAGAAIGVGIFAGINAAFSPDDKQKEKSTDQFSDAVNKFEGTVNRMGDMLGELKGKGIPNGMNWIGLDRLAQELSLGAIG